MFRNIPSLRLLSSHRQLGTSLHQSTAGGEGAEVARTARRAINEGYTYQSSPELWDSLLAKASKALPTLTSSQIAQILSAFSLVRVGDFNFFRGCMEVLECHMKAEIDICYRTGKPMSDDDHPFKLSQNDMRKLLMAFGRYQMIDSKILEKIERKLVESQLAELRPGEIVQIIKTYGMLKLPIDTETWTSKDAADSESQNQSSLTKTQTSDSLTASTDSHAGQHYQPQQSQTNTITNTQTSQQSTTPTRIQLFNFICSILLHYMSQLSPPQLADLAEGMVQVGVYDDELFVALINTATSNLKLRQFNATDGTRLLDACSRMQQRVKRLNEESLKEFGSSNSSGGVKNLNQKNSNNEQDLVYCNNSSKSKSHSKVSGPGQSEESVDSSVNQINSDQLPLPSVLTSLSDKDPLRKLVKHCSSVLANLRFPDMLKFLLALQRYDRYDTNLIHARIIPRFDAQVYALQQESQLKFFDASVLLHAVSLLPVHSSASMKLVHDLLSFICTTAAQQFNNKVQKAQFQRDSEELSLDDNIDDIGIPISTGRACVRGCVLTLVAMQHLHLDSEHVERNLELLLTRKPRQFWENASNKHLYSLQQVITSWQSKEPSLASKLSFSRAISDIKVELKRRIDLRESESDGNHYDIDNSSVISARESQSVRRVKENRKQRIVQADIPQN